MDTRSLITDDMARRELAALVAILEGSPGFLPLVEMFLPPEGRNLSLDEYSSKYLAPLADALYLRRNAGLDHPEWV